MIRIELDVMLARRKMTLTELSKRLDIALPNLSILKNGVNGKLYLSHLGKKGNEYLSHPTKPL